MELGTGIFLSAIFLGTVALFIATKDRWNWKKILLWPLGAIVTLAIVGGSFAYFYKQYEERPRKLNELWDISLSDTASDVKFKKGEPTTYGDHFWVYQPNGTTSDWSYAIYFKNKQVDSIIFYGPTFLAPSIQGISNYDTPQELTEKLGPPTYVSKSKDELRRAFSYEKFNIVAIYEGGQISAIGIYNPASGSFRFEEESENESKPK